MHPPMFKPAGMTDWPELASGVFCRYDISPASPHSPSVLAKLMPKALMPSWYTQR